MNLVQGDCAEYLKSLEDNSVDLIVADPPYEIGQINGGGTVNTKLKFSEKLQPLKTANIIDGYDIEKLGTEFIRVLKQPNIYIWCNKKQIPKYFDFYVNKLGCKFDILCWHKTNPVPTYSNKYLTDTEYLLYFHNGKCFPQNYEDAFTYYLAPINYSDKQKYSHPTIKPLDLTMKIIKNSSIEGEIVLDPFMGSGTTGVACKKLNREFIGVEIDENFFTIAKNRIESVTKKLF